MSVGKGLAVRHILLGTSKSAVRSGGLGRGTCRARPLSSCVSDDHELLRRPVTVDLELSGTLHMAAGNKERFVGSRPVFD